LLIGGKKGVLWMGKGWFIAVKKVGVGGRKGDGKLVGLKVKFGLEVAGKRKPINCSNWPTLAVSTS
jgi:hypothetical protein